MRRPEMSLLLGVLVAALLVEAAEPVCSPECLSDEKCTVLNGTTQCSCNWTSYRYLNNSELQPVAQCQGSSMNISIGRCLLESFGYDGLGVTLKNSTSTCTNLSQAIVGNRSVLSIQVPLQEGVCGNEISVNDSHVRFSNVLLVPPLYGGIVRVPPLYMTFSCSIARTAQTMLELVLNPELNSSSTTAPSPNSSYVTLNSAPLNIGIRAAFSDAQRFSLRTESCFSNPTGDPTGAFSLNLVTNGHAADQGVDTLVMENGNSSQVKFQVGMFRFVNQNRVFIYCNSRLCDTTSETCSNPGLVRNLTISSVSTTAFFIDWSPPVPPVEGAFSYPLKVLGIPPMDMILTTDYANVTGLTPGNYYTLQVCAQDGVLQGEWSTVYAYTLPDVVKNLNASNITANSILLSWLPPDGNWSSYLIEVLGDPSRNLTVLNDSAFIDQLKPGNYYMFIVSALVGEGPLQGLSVSISEYTVEGLLFLTVQTSTNLVENKRQASLLQQASWTNLCTSTSSTKLLSRLFTSIWFHCRIFQDNDLKHTTSGAFLKDLGLKWQWTTPESPDLNPIGMC